jgi:hypothetical protein
MPSARHSRIIRSTLSSVVTLSSDNSSMAATPHQAWYWMRSMIAFP